MPVQPWCARCGLCALGLPDYSRSTHKLVYENLKMKLAMQEPPILPSDDGVTSGTFEKRMRELEAVGRIRLL